MTKTHAEYMERIEAHMAADNFVRGKTWDGSKGCAIGCTFQYYDHARAAQETNVPEWLWRLEDTLFEGMSEEKSRTWPREFFKRVNFETPENQWRNKILAPFIVVVLNSALETFDNSAFPDVKAAVDGSIALWQRDDIGSGDWEKAAAEAARAARAAEAKRTAARAAWAPWAAWAAARAARAAWAAAEAAEAARAAKYDYFAGELLRIMDEANIEWSENR